MNPAMTPEIREVTESIHYRPCISIIMPFEPKMSAKAEITQQLKFATDKIEREIKENYPDDIARLVMQKLKAIVRNLNFSTFKKSIAIYVSPVFEKVLYLDIPVQEKIMIDGSFEIRDLLYSKKEMQQYLVLVLSGKWSKVYLGNLSSFRKMKSNVPDHIAAFRNDPPERVGNFSDPSYKKEVLLKKFIQHTDEGLSFLLQAYPFPVFIMGTKKVLGYFKATTKNQKNIAGYIHGNYTESTEEKLSGILKPYLDNWKKIKLDDLRHQMEKAADSGKLAIGIRDVWKQASQHRGRLLIVEKNFMCPAAQGAREDVIFMPVEPYNKFSYIKDAVDDAIEKVLEDGGDVEFVEEGVLNEYQHISLIQHY
jgi:hypothetical protein